MARILSFASWNVEHFHGNNARVARVVDLLNEESPDVFALYEIKGSSGRFCLEKCKYYYI